MATLVALVILSLAAAAPITNAPTDIPPITEPSYVPEPRGRGTVQLLFSCIITLVICIWTSIHPNIIKDPTIMRRLREKANYVILGLFSPELVLAVAWKEYLDTAKILKDAQLAGAVAYAESEAGRIRALMNNRIGGGGDDHYDRATLDSALTAVDLAISTAITEENATRVKENEQITKWIADRTNPRARMVDSEGEALLGESDSYYYGRDCWKKVGKKQLAVLTQAKRLAAAFAEYEIKRQTKNSPWIIKVYDALRRSWVRMALLWRGNGPTKYGIDRENAYFVMMGGYTFCPVKGLPDPKNELTLAPGALAYLLRLGFVTTVDIASNRPEIEDKGKSDMLAKLLVCVQGVWMVFNCISRKIAGLPLTLLELNVVMHVFCALVVYICWWKKPHDAGRPISLSQTLLDQDSWALVYTMDQFGPIFRCSKEDPEPLKEEVATGIEKSQGPEVIEEQPPTSTELPRSNPGFELKLDENCTPTERDLLICASAARKMRQLFKDGSGLVCCIPGEYPLCVPRVEMLYQPRYFESEDGLSWLLFPLCLAYGAVHATAWNSHFPTPTERTLWRISSLIVGTPGIGVFAFELVRMLSDKKSGREAFKVFSIFFFIFCLVLLIPITFGGSIYGMVVVTRRPSTALGGFLLFLLVLAFIISLVGLLCLVPAALCCTCLGNWGLGVSPGTFLKYGALTLVALVYCAARAYIVVESFISVRSLPIGAYSTFSWENFWPHI